MDFSPRAFSTEDSGALVGYIKAVYPNWRGAATTVDAQASKQAFYTGLRDLDPRDVAQAFTEWMMGNKFPPTVADLREGVSAVRRRKPREPEPKVVQPVESDDALSRWWRDKGWERREDGFMVSLYDGKPAPMMAPEESLPPLPDGTRPDRPRGRVDWLPGAAMGRL